MRETESRLALRNESTSETSAEPTSLRWERDEKRELVARDRDTHIKATLGAMLATTSFQSLAKVGVPRQAEFTILVVYMGLVPLAAAIGYWVSRRSKLLISSDACTRIDWRGREVQLFRWDEIVRIRYADREGKFQAVLVNHRVEALPRFGLEQLLMEILRRRGPSVMEGEAWVRSPRQSPVEERAFRSRRPQDFLASYLLLISFLLYACAGVIWGAKTGGMPIGVSVALSAYGLYRAYFFVRQPLERHRTQTATVNDEYVEIAWQGVRQRVYWRKLEYAWGSGLGSGDPGLLLIDDQDYVELPAGFQLKADVIELILRHAPETAVLYRIRK